MRYVVAGFCVFAIACAGEAPTAPTPLSTQSGAPAASTSLVRQSGGGVGLTAASGSELPFKGSLQATETVEGNLHQLVGTGNGTHLGQFKYAADITIDPATGEGLGTVTWTAANGDQIFATTTGEVVRLDFPNLVLAETQIITGGSGRFVGATGTVVVNRSLNLVTGITDGSFTGTINMDH
jgi:hypothetical protein